MAEGGEKQPHPPPQHHSPAEVAEAVVREGRAHVPEQYAHTQDSDIVAKKVLREGARALAHEDRLVEKGSLAAEAERADDLSKESPGASEVAQMVMKKVEQELGPSRAEELADAIVMAAAEKMSRQPPDKTTADPIQVMKDAESELVKREVAEHGCVRRHSLAAQVQSVADRAAEGGGHPLVLEKVRERLARQDIKGGSA